MNAGAAMGGTDLVPMSMSITVFETRASSVGYIADLKTRDVH